MKTKQMTKGEKWEWDAMFVQSSSKCWSIVQPPISRDRDKSEARNAQSSPILLGQSSWLWDQIEKYNLLHISTNNDNYKDKKEEKKNKTWPIFFVIDSLGIETLQSLEAKRLDFVWVLLF